MKHSNRIVITILILFVFSLPVNGNELWHVIYSGPGNDGDEINGFVIDNSNNIYVTGFSRQTGNSETITTIKYNEYGVQQWMQLFPSSGSDAAYAIAKDNLNNIYVTGYRNWIASPQCILIKYNSSGVLQWSRTFNNAVGYSVKVDNLSAIVVAGYTIGSNYDFLTLKYDNSGNLLWYRTYDNPAHGYETAQFVNLDYANNIIAAGYSQNGPSYEFADYQTVKYSPNGSEMWVRRYNGTGNDLDELYASFADRTGNVYVTGGSRNANLSCDCVTVEYAPDGTEQWAARYNGPGNLFDAGFALIADGYSNVYVAGASAMSSQNDWNYMTIKYDSNGLQQWIRYFGGSGNGGEASSIALDSSYNVYVCGIYFESQQFISALKYNPIGDLQWIQSYDPLGNFGNNYSTTLGIDQTGNVVTAGKIGSNSTFDMLTLKFSQIVGVKNDEHILPTKYQLFENYPNPFNPTTKIKFDIPASHAFGDGSRVRLCVYDILGREVATLVNEQLKPGSYEAEWDGSNFASGIYFYSLQTEQFTETKKMVLMK